MTADRTFDADVSFLSRFTDVSLLRNAEGAALAAVAAWQGRVATTVAGGGDRPGFGFLNDARIASAEKAPQINVFGGEDRFWIGPEGGPFSFYFDPGAPQEFARWRVPACLDHEAWEAAPAATPDALVFRRDAVLVNRAGREFRLGLEREIRLLDRAEIARRFGAATAGLDVVGYVSCNRLRNLGTTAFTPETGAPSLWIIGMFKAGPRTTAVVPLRPVCGGAAAPDGVRDDYFGLPPADRLAYAPDAVFLRADGRLRSKLGVAPARALGKAAAFDPDRPALAVVAYPPPADAAQGPPPYVDSRWRDDVPPFGGDAINVYNDGPNESGASFGAFYELETSSPALFLAPGETAVHEHATLHATGPISLLDAFAKEALGLSLTRFCGALPASCPEQRP